MIYYKSITGEIHAYEQSDIDNATLIADLEAQLTVLKQWLMNTLEPPLVEEETDEDKHSESRAVYKQKQSEYEAIQAQLDGILPVFFNIHDQLKTMTELTGVELDEHLKPMPTADQLADTARAERDLLIESVRWRIERHRDELALGSVPTEPLEPLLLYTQALRDVPQQTGFPTDINWPEVLNDYS